MRKPARLAVVSSRIVLPDEVRPAAIIIADGRIEAIVPREQIPAGIAIDDLGNLVVSPGVVDAHVHINEPGHTDWEGFETATRAAAAGGVTTLVDMPLNSLPVTTTVAALEEKRAAAHGKLSVDVGFYGGLVPGNLAQVEPLIDAGVCGLKAFLCDSGLPEFGTAGETELRAALPILARRGVPLLAHAEIVSPVAGVKSPLSSFDDWLASRPAQFEADAVTLLVQLGAEFRAHVHIVHLANAFLTKQLHDAKAGGIPLTVETCSHYLYFAAEELKDADPRFKCAPPIREEIHRRLLWERLVSGVIDTIGSDHSPCPPAMKPLTSVGWQTGWGGISSVQLTLPIVWTAASKLYPELSVSKLAAWLSANPAKLCGLAHKGRLAVGCDADLCVWDPDEAWTVVGAELHQRHKITPYDGETLRGRVKRTYLRGQLVFDEGRFPGAPMGRKLQRDRVNSAS